MRHPSLACAPHPFGAGSVYCPMAAPSLPESWSRVLTLSVSPQVDCGRYPAKAVVNEAVTVSADVIADGHDIVAAELLYWPKGKKAKSVLMSALGNDRYEAAFIPEALGSWFYQIRAWVAPFATWRELFRRRVEGGSPAAEIKSELKEGAAILKRAARGASGKALLLRAAERFEAGESEAAFDPEIAELARREDPREGAALGPELELTVER